jgi:hypothetical protein
MSIDRILEVGRQSSFSFLQYRHSEAISILGVDRDLQISS